MGKIYLRGQDYDFIKKVVDPDATGFTANAKGDVELVNEVLCFAYKDFIEADDDDSIVMVTRAPAKGSKAQGTDKSIDAGDKVYWDSGAAVVTKTAGGNRLIGYAEQNALDDDLYVEINFDGFKATTS